MHNDAGRHRDACLLEVTRAQRLIVQILLGPLPVLRLGAMACTA